MISRERKTNGWQSRFVPERLVLVMVAFFISAENSVGQTAPANCGDAAAVAALQSADLKTDAESLIVFLNSQRPSADQQHIIRQHIAQLNSPTFLERENASRALLNVGAVTKTFLAAARDQAPLETKSRIQDLLETLESSHFEQQRKHNISAAIDQLKALADRRAIPALFLTLADLSETSEDRLRDKTQESIWACCQNEMGASDVKPTLKVVETYLKHADENLRSAAIIALEIALGEDNREASLRISPMLSDQNETVRLAACRALIDRVPEKVTPALLELTDSTDRSIASAAITLLAMQTGAVVKYGAGISQREYWRDITNHMDSTDLKKLGDRRLDLQRRAGGILETFQTDAADVNGGYNEFQFASTKPSKAVVKDGKLIIDGNHPECDQSLFITSENLIGDSRLPDTFTVRAKLGGTASGIGAYHVGISIGDLKILFHPGSNQGAFRIEDRLKHRRHTPNVNMGFTPAANQVHEMEIRVSKNQRKGKRPAGRDFQLDIQIKDHDSDKIRTLVYFFSEEDFGKFNRVGLERSGRTGGDGIFSEFEFIPSIE